MRRKLSIAVLALIAVAAGVASTTNYVTRSTAIGTHMTIPVVTSDLWRRILPTETPWEALWDLGLTNDGTGAIVSTNGAVSTNAAGRYVADITSVDNSVRIVHVSTNSNGGMTLDLGVDPVKLLSGAPGMDFTAIRDGYTFTPLSMSTSQTNYFALDFGKTNTVGQHLIYATSVADRDIVFVYTTNASKWGLLSWNVVASGGNRKVYFTPDASLIFGLNTNGLSFTNGYAFVTVTNGYLWRGTTQSNSVWETIWRFN